MRKYEEALERAKAGKPLDEVFPELKESEEDETNGWTGANLERYLSCLQRLGTGNQQQPKTINSKWFKEHCRPKPHWKPSEEQMEALMLAIEGKWEAILPTGYMSRRLEDLYEGLANTFGVECNLEK